MGIYLAFAFVAAVLAAAAALRFSAEDIRAFLELIRPERTLRGMARRKESRILRMIGNTLAMMKETGQSGRFYFLLAAAMFLAVFGAAAGLGAGNYFLAPVLAAGLAALPFLYIRVQYIQYAKMMVDEMEVTLSTISLSIERTGNILEAVEENLENIWLPIRRVFEDFAHTVRYVNPSLESAVDTMKGRIDHSVWKEWCDALGRCIRDRSLKFTLRPIVRKLTKIKNVSGEIQNILFRAQRTFWQLTAMTAVLLGVCLYVLPNGLHITIPAVLQQVIIALNIALILFAGIKVMLETRDIRFDV
jgi:tight adherence protein B